MSVSGSTWGGGGVTGGTVGNQQHQPTNNPTTFYNGTTTNGEDPSGKPGMLEVVAGLSRDCFIIPLACVDRFLPAGLTVSVLLPSLPFARCTQFYSVWYSITHLNRSDAHYQSSEGGF